MIVDAENLLDDLAARMLRPRPLPDIVDFLEGRCDDPVTGARITPLMLIDKDDPYRGPFTTENCPDIREILRSCVSRTVRRTVIVGPTQSFKTTILVGVEAYTIAVDHGPIGHVMPSDSMVGAFSTKRFQPIVENTPWLRVLKPSNPDLFKTHELSFSTCTLRFAGSGSPGKLASWPYRRVIGDETDKFPHALRNEAGTRELLMQRVGQFTHWNAIDASTPTVPWGTIWRAALAGDCRRYHVPCPHCGKTFVQRFEHLSWSPAARVASTGLWDYEHVARTAHLRCPHCAGEIYENHRRDMLHAGRWIPDAVGEADRRRADAEIAQDGECRSYFRSCFNVLHPNRTFAAIAVKHLVAGKDPSKRQNFTNSELGEVHEEAGETIEADVLFARREDYELPADGLPDGVRVLVAGVDVQDSPARLEYEIVGYGEGLECWGIQYGIVEKRGSWAEAFAELDRRLIVPWYLRPAAGVELPLAPAAVCVDTGHETTEAYAYVKRCQPRRVYAVKGSSEGYGQPLVSRPQKTSVRAVTLYHVGTVTAKMEIISRLRLTEPGPGAMHFPTDPVRGYDIEFFRQLTAERVVARFSGGRKSYRFRAIRKRNEALDIRCYARAALDLLNPSFERIGEKMTEAVEAAAAAAEAGKESGAKLTKSDLVDMAVQPAEAAAEAPKIETPQQFRRVVPHRVPFARRW